MISLSLQQVVAITGGRIEGHLDTSARINGCVIDSRLVRTGDLFFALEGRRKHGAHYAKAAVESGALAVVLDAATTLKCPVPHIRVRNVQHALAQVASVARSKSDALIVGVTGSVGKTTARQMIHCVLQTEYRGKQSPRNYNNQLGVPLSLLRLEQDDEFAVIEVATSGPGEMRYLASIARPEMAVLTRIAPAHLQGLKSLSEIQKEKSQLLKAVDGDGVAFLNADDPLVRSLESQLRCRAVTFGVHESATVRASQISTSDTHIKFYVNDVAYELPVVGRHNVSNALAAVAVGLEVGIAPEEISNSLSRFRPADGRCAVSRIGSWSVVDDSYNSSPASAVALADFISEYSQCHHRILVLGDMLDLGEQAADLHFGVGVMLADSAIDHVLVTGQYRDSVVEGFLSSRGSRNRVSVFKGPGQLQQILEVIASDGDVIGVKGSRDCQMERVVEFLRRAADDKDGIRQAA